MSKKSLKKVVIGFEHKFLLPQKMKKHFLFEPAKLAACQIPFSFYEKKEKAKKFEVIYSPFTSKEILKNFSGKKEIILLAFNEEEYTKKKASLLSTYQKIQTSLSEYQFVQKNLKNLLFDNFRKVAEVLNEARISHRNKTPNNSYLTAACRFQLDTAPSLSFVLKKSGEGLRLEAYAEIDGEKINIGNENRFLFLFLHQNTYFMFRKLDWFVLEELADFEDFTFDDFSKNIKKKIEHLPLDLTEAFEEEIRNEIPEKIIHVSELSGNMLLFIPKWRYDGYVVESQKDTFEKIEGEKRIIYRRNKEIEQETYAFLKQSHPKFEDKNNFYLSFDEASHKNWFYHFFHAQLKDNFEVTGMDMLSFFRYSDHQIATHFEVINTVDNEINAKLEVSFGEEKINLKSLQKALVEGQKFIMLKDNSLGILNEEWLEEFGFLLRYSKILDNEITFAKWILISAESIVNFSKELQFILPENWTKRWNNWKDTNDTFMPAPSTLKAEMRNYQQKGFEWMNLMAEVNAGTLLADDMGLGKTLQTIASITSWQELNPKHKFLIICPASLLYNWKNEFEKFAPHLQIAIYHGNNRNFDETIASENSIVITSYSIVRNELENFTKLVWDAIVLDESHHIKNYTAQQTQAILKLMGKRRIALNGTPIMNNVTDLFPQLNFILPQLFYSFSKFKSDFEKPIQHDLATQQMEMLKKLTGPFIMRRTKEIVAPDLPPKTESILWCEMQEDQRFAYESLKERIKENVFVEIKNQGINKAKLGVLQGITKLRQVCSSPQLIKEEEEFKSSSSIKINQLVELLNTNLKNEKVIVFSQFIGTMDLLAAEFNKHKIAFVSFDGSTPAEKRMQLVNEFQQEESTIQVFLISLMAGNSGINLTKANYVFLVEPWWNKAIQQQAIDRTHRIGQNQHVFAYNMICKDTIEEKIITLQNRKQFISEEVISTDDNFVKNLTEEDIVYLFE